MSYFCTYDDLARFSPEELLHRQIKRRRLAFALIGFAMGWITAALMMGAMNG